PACLHLAPRSLHDALPIYLPRCSVGQVSAILCHLWGDEVAVGVQLGRKGAPHRHVRGRPIGLLSTWMFSATTFTWNFVHTVVPRRGMTGMRTPLAPSETDVDRPVSKRNQSPRSCVAASRRSRSAVSRLVSR